MKQLVAVASGVVMLVSGCGNDDSSAETVALDVGHCWIEPVTFDGANWALPRAKQFGLGDRLPPHWEGTGAMERLSENRVRYVDNGGALLIFYPADAPIVTFKPYPCA